MCFAQLFLKLALAELSERSKQTKIHGGLTGKNDCYINKEAIIVNRNQLKTLNCFCCLYQYDMFFFAFGTGFFQEFFSFSVTKEDRRRKEIRIKFKNKEKAGGGCMIL